MPRILSHLLFGVGRTDEWEVMATAVVVAHRVDPPTETNKLLLLARPIGHFTQKGLD